MMYMLIYLAAGFAFAVLMALIQGRRERGGDEPGPERTPSSVYVLIGLAWPVAAVAFCDGLLSHLLARTAPGDEAP